MTRLFDLNKDGKMSGLERAAELAWLADSLEALHESQGDPENPTAARARNEETETQPDSDPVAGAVAVMVLFFGALFVVGVIGVVLVGSGSFFLVAIASGMAFAALLLLLLAFVNT